MIKSRVQVVRHGIHHRDLCGYDWTHFGRHPLRSVAIPAHAAPALCPLRWARAKHPQRQVRSLKGTARVCFNFPVELFTHSAKLFSGGMISLKEFYPKCVDFARNQSSLKKDFFVWTLIDNFFRTGKVTCAYRKKYPTRCLRGVIFDRRRNRLKASKNSLYIRLLIKDR